MQEQFKATHRQIFDKLERLEDLTRSRQQHSSRRFSTMQPLHQEQHPRQEQLPRPHQEQLPCPRQEQRPHQEPFDHRWYESYDPRPHEEQSHHSRPREEQQPRPRQEQHPCQEQFDHQWYESYNSRSHEEPPHPHEEQPPWYESYDCFNQSDVLVERSPVVAQSVPAKHQCPPLVVTANTSKRALPSSAIDREKDDLLPADVVISKYPKFRKPSKIPTLSVKLALESFFGRSVLGRCTPKGCRDLPGLPIAELGKLKQALFELMPQFWMIPSEFEIIWTRCEENIGQSCKRLRLRHPLNPFENN